LIITQLHIDAGGVTNQALASGSDPNAGTVTDTSGTAIDNDDPTVTPLDQDPSIAVVKTAVVGGTGALGEEIAYTFTVTNTGNVTLTDVTVTDPLVGLSAITPASVASMAPGAVEIFTATLTITQTHIDAGGVTNQATATGNIQIRTEILKVYHGFVSIIRANDE
jgi:uncharacterized repeat protein (TIGR01451 family)